MKNDYRLLEVCSDRETRSFQVRMQRASDGKVYLVGRAASYGVRSNNLGWADFAIYEIIQPGAFTRALAKLPNVVHNFQHNNLCVLGTTRAGTLQIVDADDGLYYKTLLPSSTNPPNLVELVRRGDVQESSFAFTITDAGQTWEERTAGDGTSYWLRTIIEVDELFDVSTVLEGAYPKTSAQLTDRTFQSAPAELRTKVQGRLTAPVARAADDSSSDECECDCHECQAGDHEDCSNEDCTDENCGCEQSMLAAQDDADPSNQAEADRARVRGRDLELADVD